MAGYAWVLEVRPGYEEEYKKRHDEIWPEMVEALKAAGIRNYNIFRHGLTLFGYFETDDLDTALERAEAYRKAGADMLLVLPERPEQARDIGERLDGPLVYMTLAGMPSMGMSRREAGELGYRIIVDATTPLFARQRALRLCYEAIARGETDPTFEGDYRGEVDRIHDLIGLDAMLRVERRTVER